ncbi:MAG TPA: Crp/Fnr family transcriptional regulator [Sphingomicrobium sp.]|jgi:CRP-like cAMP-binding protein|nr:Crp/Fnr family transcriptional regulator [Sphingomicrobium sp.]
MTVDVDSARNFLVRNLERIGTLDADDRRGLAKLSLRLDRLPRWYDVVREGDAVDQCCLLIDGFACRYKEAATGGRQIVSFHIRGDLLDLQHLLLAQADHSIQVMSEATIAWIPKPELVRLAWERPAIGKALWRSSLIDASVFREWVLNVGRRNAKTRIAHMICEFVARCEAAGLGMAEGFELPMTQQQIADATGMTVVHANRTLRALDRDRAISRSGNHFRINDWTRLCGIGDFDPAYLHAAA